MNQDQLNEPTLERILIEDRGHDNITLLDNPSSPSSPSSSPSENNNQSNNDNNNKEEVRMISFRFEEYHYSVLFGEVFSCFRCITLPENTPISLFYRMFKEAIDPYDSYSHITLTVYSGFWNRYIGLTCFRCLQCCCFTQLLMCCFCNWATEISGQSIKENESELKGTVREIFIEQGMYLRYYKPRFRRGQHDIGIWTSNSNMINYPGSKLLLSNESDKFLQTSNVFTMKNFQFYDQYICHTNHISQLFSIYGANPTAKYSITSCSKEILSKLPILKEIIEQKYQHYFQIYSLENNNENRNENINNINDKIKIDEIKVHDTNVGDFKIELTLSQLETFIGFDNTKELLQIFINYITNDSSFLSTETSSFCPQILIRRTCICNQFIPFHIDKSYHTMQIILEKIYEVEGGNLIYLTNDNECIVTKRSEGMILYHDKNILHGVRQIDAGVRYGIFFLSK